MNPPKGLSKESGALWRMVFKSCKLMPNEITLLKIACEAYDEMMKARKILTDSGYLIKDKRVGVRANPVAGILKDSRQSFLRAWKALNFKSEDDLHKKPGRPPARNQFQFDDEDLT